MRPANLQKVVAIAAGADIADAKAQIERIGCSDLFSGSSFAAILGGRQHSSMRLIRYALLAIISGVALADPAASKECEVCISVLEQVDKALPPGDNRNQEKIEAGIEKFCSARLSAKEDKMCYYFKPIKKHISHPFALGMPKLKVCQRLKKDNSEICNIQYPMKVEKGATVDYTKMRVKELKNILNDRGVECVGCLEKSDYVKRCVETQHLEL